MSQNFRRFQLRTTDVPAARAFYSQVLGRDDLAITALPEQALARGARPHWLGCLPVDDVAQATAAFVARGAIALGPKWSEPGGFEAQALRDPGGAVLALASGMPAAPLGDVALYVLNTTNVERAKLDYGALFGWHFEPPIELGESGVIHRFAFRPGDATAGVFVDIAGRPGVHPHWLFAFRAPAALDAALAAVRAHGGLALTPLALPSGGSLAVCDDAQGAAFGLLAQTSKSSSA